MKTQHQLAVYVTEDKGMAPGEVTQYILDAIRESSHIHITRLTSPEVHHRGSQLCAPTSWREVFNGKAMCQSGNSVQDICSLAIRAGYKFFAMGGTVFSSKLSDLAPVCNIEDIE